MTTTVKSQQEFYEQYRDEVLGLANELTDFSEGSLHDIIAGALSTCQNELSELIIAEFVKTFFDLASGTEAQGGAGDTDDLEKLAVDHFGESFARPEATPATGPIDFSRPNDDAGDVLIPVGTIVKTKKDANGEEVRFQTTEEKTMVGTDIEVSVEAVDDGPNGNITSPDKITVIESTLSDPSVVVTNSGNTAGGTSEPQDPEYREIIKNKIIALAGATEESVKGAALAVSGVSLAQLTTIERVVIDYDIAEEDIAVGASFFRIPYPILYIADSNGNSSQDLIDAVSDAIRLVRAAGVRIEVRGAVAVLFDWTASVTLNGGGPNFAELSSDLSKIIDTMTEYVNTVLDIGQGFDKSDANAYVLSIWGPDGTNDLSAFSSSVPSGNVSIETNEKLIANSIQIV
jgi:hypothetical protein